MISCPQCQASSAVPVNFCATCGWHFAAGDQPSQVPAAAAHDSHEAPSFAPVGPPAPLTLPSWLTDDLRHAATVAAGALVGVIALAISLVVIANVLFEIPPQVESSHLITGIVAIVLGAQASAHTGVRIFDGSLELDMMLLPLSAAPGVLAYSMGRRYRLPQTAPTQMLIHAGKTGFLAGSGALFLSGIAGRTVSEFEIVFNGTSAFLVTAVVVALGTLIANTHDLALFAGSPIQPLLTGARAGIIGYALTAGALILVATFIVTFATDDMTLLGFLGLILAVMLVGLTLAAGWIAFATGTPTEFEASGGSVAESVFGAEGVAGSASIMDGGLPIWARLTALLLPLAIGAAFHRSLDAERPDDPSTVLKRAGVTAATGGALVGLGAWVTGGTLAATASAGWFAQFGDAEATVSMNPLVALLAGSISVGAACLIAGAIWGHRNGVPLVALEQRASPIAPSGTLHGESPSGPQPIHGTAPTAFGQAPAPSSSSDAPSPLDAAPAVSASSEVPPTQPPPFAQSADHPPHGPTRY